MDTPDWLNDDPISAQTSDWERLNRRPYVSSVVSRLEALRAQNESAVLALVGSWGSGKSSILNLMRMQLTTAPRVTSWKVLEFNPWHFQDAASLQFGFFRELYGAVPTGRTWDKARDGISSFLASVSPLGALSTPFIGVSASAPIEWVSKVLKKTKTIAASRAEAEAALKTADQAVLMVLDDLDRLDPTELLQVFKLIRLTGKLPNLYYMVAYDEETLLDSLSRTGLVGENDHRRGLDYLEKIVQVRLDVPPLTDQQVTDWVEESLREFAHKHRLAWSQSAQQRFNEAYNEHIRQRLTTPRSIKRFFGQIESFINSVRDEVDEVDFILMTWVRTAEPAVYDALFRNRERLLGVGGTLIHHLRMRAAHQGNENAGRQYWEKQFSQCRVRPSDWEGLASVLGVLFPRFGLDWRALPGDSAAPKPELKRVSHPYYFDRYFHFGVPKEDISDSVLFEAYDAVIHRVSSNAALAQVESLLRNRPEYVLDKFRARFETDSAGAREMLAWLAKQVHALRDVSGIPGPRNLVLWFAVSIFDSLGADQIQSAIDEVLALPGGLVIVPFLLDDRDQQTDIHPAERTRLIRSARLTFCESVRARFDEERSSGPSLMSPDVWRLVWPWVRFDSAGAREWFDQVLQEGDWSVSEVLAGLVSTRTAVGVEHPVEYIDHLDLDLVKTLIGIPRLFTSLQTEIEDADAVVAPYEWVVATPAARLSYALAVLRHRRSELT